MGRTRVDDRGQDRRLPVIGADLTAVTGPGTGLRTRAVVRTVNIVRAVGRCLLAHALSLGPALVIGRLAVAPFVIQWPCGPRCAQSAWRGFPWEEVRCVRHRAHTT